MQETPGGIIVAIFNYDGDCHADYHHVHRCACVSVSFFGNANSWSCSSLSSHSCHIPQLLLVVTLL